MSNNHKGLEDLLAEVVEWGEETFPTVNTRAKIEHLSREVEELRQHPTAAEEIADIMMITAHIAADSGIDLKEAIADKFEIVKAREWEEPDEDGVVEHTRENEPRYLFEDLLHVYDNWSAPKLSTYRLAALISRGWVYKNTSNEVIAWEVTFAGWKVLEELKMVPKAYGG